MKILIGSVGIGDYFCIRKLSHGVTGNTSDSGSEESRFEPWWDNNLLFISTKTNYLIFNFVYLFS